MTLVLAGAVFAALLHVHPCPVGGCWLMTQTPGCLLQELMSERARLAAEVESLKASTAAEANVNKAELGAQRDKLEQQAADLAARTEALAAGEVLFLHVAGPVALPT